MTLGLFFTRGVSLKIWIQTGIIDREKRIYEEHLKSGLLKKIYWFTYGSRDRQHADELKLAGRLPSEIVVVSMPGWLRGKIGSLIYSLILPVVQAAHIRACDILKTNQIDGSWTAVLARWFFDKPLVVRAGYLWSVFLKKGKSARWKQILAAWCERLAFHWADRGIVASRLDKEYVQRIYKIDPGKIAVSHNFVDTHLFHPPEKQSSSETFVFVGRLSEQKNLFQLIEASAAAGIPVDIYGQGELEQALKDHAQKLEARVNFKGIVPNDELPRILGGYRFFILASLYEGMPKALLEAMACGLICVGTDVEGINEVIRDDHNGYLCRGTGFKDIANMMKKVLKVNKDINRSAVKTIKEFYSLEGICTQERKLLQEMV